VLFKFGALLAVYDVVLFFGLRPLHKLRQYVNGKVGNLVKYAKNKVKK